MPSKLFNDEPNCYNEDVIMEKPPSYQMQTISSRLKIVNKDHYHNKNVERIPFTVGSSFVTHNVKLLKQETLKKLKTIMLSYKNENIINCRNINELRSIKYDIDTYHLESIKLNYFTLEKKHYINSTSKYRLFNKPKSEQNCINFWKQSASPEHHVKQLLNVGCAGNVEQELTTLLRLHNQLENMIKDKSNYNSKAKTAVHVEAEKPVEYPTRFQSKIRNDEHYSPVIQQSEISVDGQNSYSSKASFKKDKKRTKKYYVDQFQDVQREIIENEEEYNNRIADLKEKLKLSGDPTVLNLTDFDLQEPNKRSFAPSVYSRKKRRRRIRRYVVPELDDNITLEENENKNSASEIDENMSMRSFTIKQINRNKFKNACTVDERPASQPV